MVQKLEPIKEFDCSDTPQANMQHHRYHNDCVKKINELCDVVNELTNCVGQLGVEFTDPTPTKNAQDKFSEQRKWIGKLCRFWDTNYEDHIYRILHRIEPDDICPYKASDGFGGGYIHCEPVKPDDSIICQGE